MKKIKKISVFLITAGILLIGAAVIMQLFTPLGSYNNKGSEGTEYFSGVREIIVVSGSHPVNLSYTDSDECELSWLSELPLIVNCDEQGVLRVTQDDSFTLSLFALDSENYNITLKIPRKSYGRISLAASSGNITVSEDIAAESLEVSTKNGGIYVMGADERTKIRSAGGDIRLTINELNGDMTVNGGEGDIYVNVPPGLPFFMEFSTENGSCTTSGFENDIEKDGDAVFLSGKGGIDLKINTTGGNLELLSDVKRPPVTE